LRHPRTRGSIESLYANGIKRKPAMSTLESPPANPARADALPPSVSIRCGGAETAAILQMLDRLDAARDAIEAWDGVTRDPYQRARQKYARLLADLLARHPQEVLAGLRSPQAHTRIWVALAVAQAPAAIAIPPLKQALVQAAEGMERKALEAALQACRGT